MNALSSISLFTKISMTLLLVMDLGLPVSSKSKPVAVKTVKVWHLKQSHKIYGRDIDIYLTDKYFKWLSNDSRISIVMTAPDWQVNAFNSGTGNLFKCRAEEFKSPAIRMARLCDGIDWAKLPLKRVDQLRISGIVIDHFRSGQTHINLKRCDYWVTRTLPVDKNVIVFMSKLYDGPVGAGIPIKHLYLRPDANTPTKGIETRAIGQEMVPLSTFSIPKGLKLKNAETDIFADKRHEQGLDWMIK